MLVAATVVPGSRSATAASANSYDRSLGCCYDVLSSNDLDRQLTDLSTLGVNWQRLDVHWVAVQPAGPNDWQWTKYDTTISRMRAHGFQVLG